MSRSKYPPAMIALALLAAGCGSAGGGEMKSVSVVRVHVGMIGKVRRGPIAPVERPGVDNSEPLAGARITVAREGRESLGVVVSDSVGVFALVLGPGAYTLTPQPLDEYPVTPAPQRVVVPDGGIGRVTFTYDTGIR